LDPPVFLDLMVGFDSVGAWACCRREKIFMELGKASTESRPFKAFPVEPAAFLTDPALVAGLDIGAAPGNRSEGVFVFAVEGGESPPREGNLWI
jgi:hypothetical protein